MTDWWNEMSYIQFFAWYLICSENWIKKTKDVWFKSYYAVISMKSRTVVVYPHA